jgi:tetratricopeptide (TPR) repeat protein
VRKTLIFPFVLFLAMSAFAANAVDQWQKGKEAYDRGEYSKAILYFKKAAEASIKEAATESPQSGDYYKWLGVAYWNNKQYQEAIDTCQMALRLPHNPTAEPDCWWYLAVSQDKLDQTESALSSCKKYIELAPDNPNAFSLLSGLCIKSKQFDEAIAAAKRAIELNPNNDWAAYAYSRLGAAYRNKKQYDEAFDAFEKAIELDANNAGYRHDLGWLYYARDDFAEASAAYAKAVELQPNWRVGLFDLAGALRLAGKYDEALTAVNQALDIVPSTGDGAQKAYQVPDEAAYCFGLRSQIYRYQGKPDQAFLDAQKAYSLNPANSFAQISLGTAYLDRGQYDESVRLLSQVKNNPRARILEATAKAKLGRTQEAEEMWASIPEDRMPTTNIPLMADRAALLQIFKPWVKEHRNKAASFEAKGQFKEALLELSEALKAADDMETPEIKESVFGLVRKHPSLSEMPEEARRHALRGEMLIKDGNFEQAATEITAAIRIAPYVAQLYYNSALVQAQLKNYSEAIRQMKIYVQAVPDAPDARAAKDEIIKWEFLLEKKK